MHDVKMNGGEWHAFDPDTEEVTLPLSNDTEVVSLAANYAAVA